MTNPNDTGAQIEVESAFLQPSREAYAALLARVSEQSDGMSKLERDFDALTADLIQKRERIAALEASRNPFPFRESTEKPERNRPLIVRWDNSYYAPSWDEDNISISDRLTDFAKFTDESSFECERKDTYGRTFFIRDAQIIWWIYVSDLTAAWKEGKAA